jgi:hypothetical protein
MASAADAERLLEEARRPLVVGIGGGGDVVGALATAALCGDFVLGGVAWERRVIDPAPGPRSTAEIEGAEELAPCVLLASPDTSVRESGVVFAESRMAGVLGERTVLLDITRGPARLAEGLGAAMRSLGCDLAVFVDVGGDALAHGGEPGLASPLCDSIVLAAAARLQAAGVPVLGGVFGIGCDGELTPAEVMDRVAEVAAAGGLAGVRGISPATADRLEDAVAAVPTEASAMALRCFRGDTGEVEIRRGLRTVPLSPLGALTFYFDVAIAVGSAARLAAVVMDARDLEHANDLLHEAGVRSSELDFERRHYGRPAGSSQTP